MFPGYPGPTASTAVPSCDIVTPQEDARLADPNKMAVPALPKEQWTMDPQHRSSCKRGSRQCFFEIANVRQACSLKTIFSTLHQASRYLRQNWNRIEQMARDRLARECFEDGGINLVMI